MHFAPALWPSCTSHHAVLSARHLSIHPPCQHPLPVSSSPPISWPHHLSIILLLLLHVEAFPLLCFLLSSPNRCILCLLLCQSFLHFHLISYPSFPLFLHHLYSNPTPLFSASLQWQVLWAGCVNVKPFPAMIMFITHCVSRCPWINTNWRSTLQR